MAASAAVVVQARAGSTRLPGKVLLPFAESTLLGHILDRMRRAGLPVWLATSSLPDDDAVAAEGERHDARVYRGDALDVLGRFAGCIGAMSVQPDVVVRICADRPFCCPVLLTELLERFEETGRPDYLSNTLRKSYPDGLDLELVRTERLLEAAAAADDPYEREHVTPFLYRRPERFRLVEDFCGFGNFSGVRAVIDTDRDFRALSLVQERLHDLDAEYDYRVVLDLAALEPEAFA